MKSLKRKNFLIDEETLKKAKRILRAKTESEAVRQALSLVAFRRAVMQGYDRAAGKYPEFGTVDRDEDKIVYDTSVYIEVLRSKTFAEAFRSRTRRIFPLRSLTRL